MCGSRLDGRERCIGAGRHEGVDGRGQIVTLQGIKVLGVFDEGAPV